MNRIFFTINYTFIQMPWHDRHSELDTFAINGREQIVMPSSEVQKHMKTKWWCFKVLSVIPKSSRKCGRSKLLQTQTKMSVETNPWFQEKEYKSVWLVIQDSKIWIPKKKNRWDESSLGFYRTCIGLRRRLRKEYGNTMF